MTGGSPGLRTASYGSLQQQIQNGGLATQTTPSPVRKPPKVLSSSREKERILLLICRFFGRRRVAMLLLGLLALLVLVIGSFIVNKAESTSFNVTEEVGNMTPKELRTKGDLGNLDIRRRNNKESERSSVQQTLKGPHKSGSLGFPHPLVTGRSSTDNGVRLFPSPSPHPCEKFILPSPPPNLGKRTGPRPCPVCYVPVEQAIASMPNLPSKSPVLQYLSFARDENPQKTEPHGGSDFGGYPSLKQRNESFDIMESMTVHCGFVKGSKPGQHSGFDIDEIDIMELEKFHEVIVASAIFGNYDVIQQPKNISEASMKNVPFYMFIDEETEAYMKNSSLLDSSKKVGLWRVIVARNVPYADPRRNGKVPKLLLHRLFPNVRYSLWIDGKLQLVVDPYQILERFLWRHNATFAISKHYKRFDVFEEAAANKAAGKYSNSSIDEQIGFYVKEGLTPYSSAKLPITSDVPEGCVIIREHIPITNLFTCLWFNEVDRFTSRDQLSFSTVRDKIMARVNWNISMFLDCERRNFVIQVYHRDLLELMPPPARPSTLGPPALPSRSAAVKLRKNPAKRARDKRSSGRRHRKVVAGSRDQQLALVS